MIDNLFNVNSQALNGFELISVISFLAIAYITYLNRRVIKKNWLSYRTRYCLSHLGLEQLSNIQIADGLDHHFILERLLLRHDGITLLVYKKYSGKIFCADHIHEWTQMLGQKSYPFNNPLFELDNQIKAITALFPDIHIDGFIFFDHTSTFPKGHPDRVMHPNLIPEELHCNSRHQINPKVMSAWKTLQSKQPRTK